MTTGPPVGPPATDPDRTSRRLRARPLAAGLIGVALFAGLLALVLDTRTLAMLMLALLGLVVFDAVSARSAVARVEPTLTNPVDGVAGEPAVHVVQARHLTAPVDLVPAGWWPTPFRPALTVRTSEPGTMILQAPTRGVVTHVVFDVIATGPLGLAEAACRVRVWLPVAWSIAPPPAAHDPGWPALRTTPPGESTTVTRGDDLFRGVRPYTRGDPRRAVHWPATAHRGTLMVKERDGIEQVALRIVLELTHLGPEADLAAGRAAWLVDHALSRGWRVQLVTAEGAPHAPVPLQRPWGPLGRPPAVAPADRTVDRRIDRAVQARQQLSAAGVGTPLFGAWTGLTRVVTTAGDAWR
jgi:uncharacterized protein (DUF58 family)